jgi:SAM-dependent methyltransferase
MSEIPWYQEFFGEDYLRMYALTLAPERTAREVEGIVRLLDLPAGSSILDLCCGHGRHAIPLAQRGFQVTGQDLCPVFLQRAQADAQAQSVSVRWVHGDMRAIPFENEFDAVINIFTAFGYFESEEEDQKVLQQVHRALKPGGRFLLETKHREDVMRQYRSSGVTRFDDGLLVTHESELDLLASRNAVRMTMLFPDGRRKEYRHSVRMYTLTELARLCDAAGLRLEAHHGSLDGSPLTLDSKRLVLLTSRADAAACGR